MNWALFHLFKKDIYFLKVNYVLIFFFFFAIFLIAIKLLKLICGNSVY